VDTGLANADKSHCSVRRLASYGRAMFAIWKICDRQRAKKLHDRTSDEISLDEVERIAI
jgi:hypothetical protein